MTIDRRRWLALSGLAGLASLAPPFVLPASARGVARAASGPPIALLLPLTGHSADLAQSMARAAALAQPLDQKDNDFLVLDTGSTPAGAANAAAQAVAGGAAMILGPLFAAQVAPVVAAAAGRPVLSFSNDAALIGGGAFVLGITASQGVSAILTYARSRGVRRVAVLTSDDSVSRQSVEAATATAQRVGLTSSRVDFDAAVSAGAGLDTFLAVAGAAPDAVLFSQSDANAGELCRRLVEQGIQILGPPAWAQQSSAFLGAADGAWIAAPDPEGFTPFARTFEARHSTAPGLLAGLAFDGAAIARRLRAAGRLSREGLLSPEGFQGALGAVHFRADGGCSRELAIQVAGQGALRVVAHATGT